MKNILKGLFNLGWFLLELNNCDNFGYFYLDNRLFRGRKGIVFFSFL